MHHIKTPDFNYIYVFKNIKILVHHVEKPESQVSCTENVRHSTRSAIFQFQAANCNKWLSDSLTLPCWYYMQKISQHDGVVLPHSLITYKFLVLLGCYSCDNGIHRLSMDFTSSIMHIIRNLWPSTNARQGHSIVTC